MGEALELWSDRWFSSPWVLSVWTVLKQKELPFDIKTVDLLRGEHQAGNYPARTLTAKVPALRHGDFWIAESLAIIEYLEEVFPPPKSPPVLASDARARARDRQLMSWIRSDLFELRESMPFEGIFYERPTQEVTVRAREQAERLLRVAAAVVPDRRPATPTAADFDLAFMLRRLVHYRYDLEGYAAVVSYAEAIWSLPGVQSYVRLERPSSKPRAKFV